MKIPSLRMLFDYAGGSPERRAAVLALASLGVLAGAWFIELGLGYAPCKLCLIQRWPFYAALPLAGLAWVISGPIGFPRAARPAFGMLASIFMISVALGAHHAGVEWGWWAGPSDCGGRIREGVSNASDLLAAMEATKIVSCTDAPFRIMGLSLAGWNAAISFILAMLAIRGWRQGPSPFAMMRQAR
jgi:disulfide bond formation protein DsbB